MNTSRIRTMISHRRGLSLDWIAELCIVVYFPRFDCGGAYREDAVERILPALSRPRFDVDVPFFCNARDIISSKILSVKPRRYDARWRWPHKYLQDRPFYNVAHDRWYAPRKIRSKTREAKFIDTFSTFRAQNNAQEDDSSA